MPGNGGAGGAGGNATLNGYAGGNGQFDSSNNNSPGGAGGGGSGGGVAGGAAGGNGTVGEDPAGNPGAGGSGGAGAQAGFAGSGTSGGTGGAGGTPTTLTVRTTNGDTYTIEVDGDQLDAILQQASPTGPAYERLKAYAESRAGNLAFVNQGLDFILNKGFGSAMTTTSGPGFKFGSFGGLGGGWSRYHTGSHVDVSGLSLLAGIALGNDAGPGRVTLGALFEAGWGNYNSYNSFSQSSSVNGKGNMDYYGGGILGRYDVYAINDYVAPYIGAYWEHEFDGKARATVNGVSLGTPSLQGDTGMGELGLSLKPAKDLPLSFDLGVQGYAGKRDGVTGSLQIRFEF